MINRAGEERQLAAIMGSWFCAALVMDSNGKLMKNMTESNENGAS